ncbi:GldG family protein [Dokdonella sp.]|uniref:GldG family protein n=1 Tax=Dokdonella sp. TaxID=2291710 RepID=UPI0031C063A1|nr:Gldg family protein [Dokdonella sp.]
MRTWLTTAVHAALVVLIAGLLAFLSTRYGFEHDFSHARSASLGPQSRALLARLDGPVEVVSYARTQGGLRPLIAAFIARYQRDKPDVTLRFVDPDADPGAMRAAGVSVDGELEIRYGERSERLKVLSEAEFSSTLLRLSRGGERIVAFLEGEGERSPLGQANADLGQFVGTLATRGLHAVPLPLARTGKVPDNTDLVVVANPRVGLPAAVAAELVDYIDGGGALLWLAEPGEPGLADEGGLDLLARSLGLRVLPGTVVDAGGQAFGIADPSFVAVTAYPAHAITADFSLTTLLPQAAALARLTDSRWAAAPLLRSGQTSWNETGPIPRAGEAADTIRQDAEAGELPGPLDLAFALTRVSPRPDRREQRIVVIGDGDFLSNSFLGNGGNREFGQRVFDWLLGDDAQIQVPDKSAPDRELRFSQAALTTLAATFLVGLPLLLAGSGLAVWWRRRRR